MQITVVRGPAKGRTYMLGPARVILGRDDGADLQLGDPRVSRQHAEIRPGEGRTWILQDLGSTNHTFLNGRRIRQAEIHEGDEIVVGDTHIAVQHAVVTAEAGEVLSMRLDAESIRRTLSDGDDWSAGGKRLQEALFQVGLLSDPALDADEIVRRTIPIIEEGVPFISWAWVRWPDGLEQPYEVIGLREGEDIDPSTFRPQDSLVRRAIRGRRGVVSAAHVNPEQNGPPATSTPRVAAMAIPILSRGMSESLIYFERDFRFPPFHAEELAWAAALTSQLTRLLENARLFENLRGAHERLRTSQAQLNSLESLALIGRLATSFAHDLNNPLTSLLGFLELSRRVSEAQGIEGKLPDYLSRAHYAADYCRALCRNLLAVARQKPFSEADLVSIDVKEVVESTLEICSTAIQGIGAETEVRVPEGLELVGDPSTLQQIVMNLVVNAADALAELPEHAPRIIAIDATSNDEGCIVLEVHDSGPGIPPGIQEQMFEPLVSGKDPRKGTGLGLYVVSRVLAEAGGTVEVESSKETGTTFRLTLGSKLHRLTSEEIEPNAVPDPLLEEYS